MRYILAAFLVIAFALPSPAAEKPKQEDDSWMQGYYQHPQPERFEAEVKKLKKSGALQNGSAFPPLAAFFSRLFQSATTAQLVQWLRFIQSLPEEDQTVFLVALRWANIPETQDALEKIAAGKGQGATFARKMLEAEVPALDKITVPSAGELDMCWGAFFATGDSVYVLPVFRCAVKPSKANNIDLSQQAARWSLKALCRTHQKVRDIKDAFYTTASPEERETLDELFKK